MSKIAVTVQEAAEMIGVGRTHMYALFKERKIVPRKSGGRTLIIVTELEDYINSLPSYSDVD